MTSVPTVRSISAGPYGALELQKVAHRYLYIALGVSIVVHILLLCLYFLLSSIGKEVVIPVRMGDGPRIIDLTPPGIGWPILPDARPFGARGPVVKNATPVPVPETPLSAASALPTQGDLSNQGSPVGDGTIAGSGETGIFIEEPEEEAPPPFVAVESLPKSIKTGIPEYPAVAARAGVEGRVLVSVWVDKHGRPKQVLIASSTNDLFNEAALEAARKYLFVPAYMNSGPVSVWVTLAFNFRLK
jgi:TonB family protein